MCGFYILLVGLLSVGLLPNAVADDHTYVKLPNDNVLMSLADFEAEIVGKQMGEMYFGLGKPPAFVPDIHYKSTISKITGSRNYTQVTIGETPGENSRCARGNQNLSPVHHDKALFYNDDIMMRVQAIWSSDPSKYIWSMRCSNYRPGRRRCSFAESTFGLYVHGNLDDVPSTMFEDLCKATGLKFGSEKFKWTFTHGENMTETYYLFYMICCESEVGDEFEYPSACSPLITFVLNLLERKTTKRSVQWRCNKQVPRKICYATVRDEGFVFSRGPSPYNHPGDPYP